jgi:hypothetical protein
MLADISLKQIEISLFFLRKYTEMVSLKEKQIHKNVAAQSLKMA